MSNELTDSSILNICSVAELMPLRQAGEYDELLVAFSRAIVDADRALCQAEPVEYQAKVGKGSWRIVDGGKKRADYIQVAYPGVYQVRALYAAPQPSEIEALKETDFWIRQATEARQAELSMREDVGTKDAEIAALTAQLASFARGVKISIPTETMEYEFHLHYKRGVASKANEIAALKAAGQRALDAWQTSCYGDERHHREMLMTMTALAQAVQS